MTLQLWLQSCLLYLQHNMLFKVRFLKILQLKTLGVEHSHTLSQWHTHSHNDTHTLTMTHTHSHTYTDTLTLTHKHSQTWTVFWNSFKKRKEKKTYFNHFGFCSWESQDQDLILWGLFERKKFPVKLFFCSWHLRSGLWVYIQKFFSLVFIFFLNILN